jgi:tRNA(Ile)-lysidine synthase
MHDHPVDKAVHDRLSEMGAIGEPLLIGVSGGADSVALLRAILNVCDGPSALRVAHLDHGLRPASAADAKWVTRLADALDVQSVVRRQEVTAVANMDGRGTEEAARDCRYRFFAEVAAEYGCRLVAVAHTADDQTETILHHLLRGTGLAGLRGMPESRPLDDCCTLIRPLLQVSRQQVLVYLEALGQPYRCDASNDDQRFTRNRLRHSLLPLLREQYNPRVDESLRRLGEQARDVQSILESLGEDLLAEALVEQTDDRVTLSADSMSSAPRHLLREAFRLLFIRQEWSRGRIRFDDWDQLATIAQSPQAARSLTLPNGLRAQMRRGRLTIERS